MEKDDEVKGKGNSYDFGARLLDTRLGRWLTIDPFFKQYSHLSNYSFVANSPLIFLDPDGRIIEFANRKSRKQYEKLGGEIILISGGANPADLGFHKN